MGLSQNPPWPAPLREGGSGPTREATEEQHPLSERTDSESDFASLFQSEFPRLFRYLDRLSGDPDLASDLAQEAFVRLHRRGSAPESPGAWLATVATNLFRNQRKTAGRRRRLLTLTRGAAAHSDPPPPPSRCIEADEERRRVRAALDRLSERDRQLLLLRAEGYSYRELANILDLLEASVGTSLARARASFKEAFHHAT